MSTVVTIKNVRVFENEEYSNVSLTINETIKGFKLDKDTNVYQESDTNTIAFSKANLCRQLYQLNDDIALYRAVIGRSFTQKELGIILFNAKLTLSREFKAAGEIINDKPIERDCYITTITSIKLSDKASKQLDIACAL